MSVIDELFEAVEIRLKFIYLKLGYLPIMYFLLNKNRKLS